MNRTVRPLAALTAAAAAFLLAFYWPHVRNEIFVLLGNRNEGGGWYGFHSGFGGAYYISVFPLAALLYWHHTCHVSWCLRPGRHRVDGSPWCNKHHILARQKLAATGSAHDLQRPAVKRALVLLGVAAVCVTGGGWLLSAAWHLSYGHGLYCAIGTASTVGCDTGPTDPAGRLAVVAVMLSATPMLAAVFALATARLAGRHASERAAEHVAAAEKRLTDEADRRHAEMRQHVERLLAGTAVAERVVPPAARRRQPKGAGQA